MSHRPPKRCLPGEKARLLSVPRRAVCHLQLEFLPPSCMILPLRAAGGADLGSQVVYQAPTGQLVQRERRGPSFSAQ